MRTRIHATVPDMAEQYRISDETVRARVRSGEWPADRIGRLIRFSPDQQDQIAASLTMARVKGRRSERIREAIAKLAS